MPLRTSTSSFCFLRRPAWRLKRPRFSSMLLEFADSMARLAPVELPRLVMVLRGMSVVAIVV